MAKTTYEVVESKTFSLKGWKVREFIVGNKEFLKAIIPALIAWAVTQDLLSTGIATIVSKSLLDVIDYYVGNQIYLEEQKK